MEGRFQYFTARPPPTKMTGRSVVGWGESVAVIQSSAVNVVPGRVISVRLDGTAVMVPVMESVPRVKGVVPPSEEVELKLEDKVLAESVVDASFELMVANDWLVELLLGLKLEVVPPKDCVRITPGCLMKVMFDLLFELSKVEFKLEDKLLDRSAAVDVLFELLGA